MSQANDETIKELLGTVRELVREETDRASSLNARATVVVGSVGIIVSVSLAVANSLFRADISANGQYLVAIGFALALGAVAASMILVVLGVLRIRHIETFGAGGEGGIDRWSSPPFTTQEPREVRRWLLENWIEILAKRRRQNNEKARALRLAFYVLAGGILVGVVWITLAAWIATR